MTTTGGVLAALVSLFALVAVGSIVPVLPTGAVVSATAALAVDRDVLTSLAVVVVAGVAAYGGDAVTYVVCRAGGEPLARRLTLSRRQVGLARAVQAGLRTRPVPALVVGRLLPAGRIPTLLAAAVVGVPWRRFAVANVAACVAWSVTYAAVGMFGGAVFAQPWQGVAAAVVLVLVLSLLVGRMRRRRKAHADAAT